MINVKKARTVLNIWNYFIDFIQIIIGTAVMAAGTALFMIPNKLSTGGFSGIGTIFYYLFNAKVGIVILILNIPLFIVACFKLGMKFLSKALVGTLFLSVFIDSFTRIGGITEDKLLASIYGGIIVGIGTAIVLKANASTGGSDLFAIILTKFNPSIQTSKFIVIIDATIIFVSTVVFKQLEIALYSAIAIFLMGKVMDVVLEGINFAKMIYIISDKNIEISQKIGKDIKRGTTLLYGKGMYRGEERNVLLCVASRSETNKINLIIKKTDKHAFTIISNARKVLGKGFK